MLSRGEGLRPIALDALGVNGIPNLLTVTGYGLRQHVDNGI
jgi:hypothetical protein